MNRSELRQIIREEYRKALREEAPWDNKAPEVSKAKLNKEFGAIRKELDASKKRIKKALGRGIDIHVLLGGSKMREIEDEIDQALEDIMTKLMDDVRKGMKG